MVKSERSEGNRKSALVYSTGIALFCIAMAGAAGCSDNDIAGSKSVTTIRRSSARAGSGYPRAAHGQRFMRRSSLQVRLNIHLSQSVTMAAAPAFITHLGAATPGAHVLQS